MSDHFCGLCRVGVPHDVPEKVGTRDHLEKLFVRCLVAGAITQEGVTYLWTLL